MWVFDVHPLQKLTLGAIISMENLYVKMLCHGIITFVHAIMKRFLDESHTCCKITVTNSIYDDKNNEILFINMID